MSSFKKHLLIDGYNIIHAWPNLRKTLNQLGLDQARTQLADTLRIIHDLEQIRLTIVFDGKGTDIEIQRPTPDLTFSFLYSPSGIPADTLIAQLAIPKKNNNSITVATDDNMIRQAVIASGSTVISALELDNWVKACQKQQTQNIQDHQKSSQKLWKQQSPWDILS